MRLRVLLTGLVALLAMTAGVRPAAALGESCTIIGATGLVFNTSYTFNADNNSSGTFQVKCTCGGIACTGVSYRVQISAGTAGGFAPRQMAFGASRLDYNLSAVSGMSPVWGTGASGTSTENACFLLLVGGSVTNTYTVYGRIPAGSTVAPGGYGDPLTITVEYYSAIPPLTCTFT